MNIKPGSVNQKPLYGCTGCYEDFSWPSCNLRVHDGECWCELCWCERRWGFPDLPYWDDLEPYTPAEQQPDVAGLVWALKQILGWRELRSGREFPIERIEDIARAALAPYRKGVSDVE